MKSSPPLPHPPLPSASQPPLPIPVSPSPPSLLSLSRALFLSSIFFLSTSTPFPIPNALLFPLVPPLCLPPHLLPSCLSLSASDSPHCYLSSSTSFPAPASPPFSTSAPHLCLSPSSSSPYLCLLLAYSPPFPLSLHLFLLLCLLSLPLSLPFTSSPHPCFLLTPSHFLASSRPASLPPSPTLRVPPRLDRREGGKEGREEGA